MVPPEEVLPDREPYGHGDFLEVLQDFEKSNSTDLTRISERVLQGTGQKIYTDDRSLIRIQFDPAQPL